ncbi:hypothetical protein FRC00_014651 [Tulasnella sp. 408]|nr:hypothetical protein FRC00_014651 [Tulasnella sp. 408]
MAFSTGLVCFTYSSAQGLLVTTCATIFTSLTTLALLAVAVWFAMERVVYAKTKGSRWLEDIIREWSTTFLRRTGLLWLARAPPAAFKKVATWSNETLAKFGIFVSSTVGVPTRRRGSASTGSEPYDEEYAAGLPTPNSSPKAGRLRRFSSVLQDDSQDPPPPPTSPTPRMRFKDAIKKVRNLERMKPTPTSPKSPGGHARETPLPQPFADRGASSSPAQEQAPWSRPRHDHPPSQGDAQDHPLPPTSPTQRMSVQDAVEEFRDLESIEPVQKPPTNLDSGSYASERSPTVPLLPDGYVDSNIPYAPPLGLIPKLKALKPTQELTEHRGLVRHLQFSPDGKWLATCSWDTTAIIWKVEGSLSQHRILAHAGAGFLSQVAWSPDGKYLLTRTLRQIKVWVTETGVLKPTIHWNSNIQAVTWFPASDSFACVEGSFVHIMDLEGKIKADHTFERLDIRDAAVTKDGQRMILVATEQGSQDNPEASKSKTEKRILVYHLTEEKIECQLPARESIRNVTVSSDTSNGYLALISYDNTTSPELWRISVVNSEARQEVQLQLLHTYMPTAVVEFAGPAYLGGPQGRFVISAGKKGDIHIWDRERNLLLHSIHGANMVNNTPEDVTGVAWNDCVPGGYMFASATNGGTVRIWAAQAPPDGR